MYKFSTNCFISAFPGKIVFGKCSPSGYNDLQYFEFAIFELYSLYLAIFDIVNNFSKKLSSEHQLLIAKENNTCYIFCVKTLTNLKNEHYQAAYFAIENTSGIVFELIFTVTEFNEFLFT